MQHLPECYSAVRPEVVAPEPDSGLKELDLDATRFGIVAHGPGQIGKRSREPEHVRLTLGPPFSLAAIKLILARMHESPLHRHGEGGLRPTSVSHPNRNSRTEVSHISSSCCSCCSSPRACGSPGRTGAKIRRNAPVFTSPRGSAES